MATPPGPYYLAEWYSPALSDAQVDATTAALQAAAATLTNAGNDAAVGILSVIAAPTDDLLYALFTATAAHLVAQTCTAAGLPIDRLTVGVYARILT